MIDIGSILKRLCLTMEKKVERKKRIDSMNSNWQGLPPHIVKVVLSKLPISTLSICRLVCKTWNHLILDYANSSPKFLSNAFLLSTSDIVPNSNPTNFCNPKIHCIDIDTKHLEWMSSVASFGFECNWSDILILNSCNGLLLVSKFNYDTLCRGILNPMTTKFFKLPPFEFEDDIYFFGFGFSTKTQQYKLFRVSFDETQSTSIMEVYRFGTNQYQYQYQYQWRHLHSLPLHICFCGAYLDGVIYWIGNKEEQKDYEYVIYALDVETENIELVAVLEVGPHVRTLVFEPFNGTICATFFIYPAFFKCRAPSEIQVWMMQEHKHSWIREFAIHDIPNDWLLQHGASIDFSLVKAFEDGEILCLINGDFFCLYNPKTGRKKIKMLHQNERRVVQFCHLESFNFGSLPNILAGVD